MATNDWFGSTALSAFGFGGASFRLADVARHLRMDGEERTEERKKVRHKNSPEEDHN